MLDYRQGTYLYSIDCSILIVLVFANYTCFTSNASLLKIQMRGLDPL